MGIEFILVGISGDISDRRFPVTQKGLLVGRSPSADISLEDLRKARWYLDRRISQLEQSDESESD